MFANKIIKLLITFYKFTVSPIIHWLTFSFFGLHANCRFSPSCSEYAIRMFSDDDFLKASLLVLKRLSQCHPWYVKATNLQIVRIYKY